MSIRSLLRCLAGFVVLTVSAAPVSATIIGSGEVSPASLIGTTNADVDITGQGVDVNQGSVEVNAGTTLSADTLNLAGNPATSNSQVLVTGSGSRFNVLGNNNRLNISQGTGTITVSDGGFLDAGGTGCDPNLCSNFIGHFAGSTANLNISGAQSRVDTTSSLALGGTGVHDQTIDGFSAGQVGATTNVNVVIEDGGTLNSSGRTFIGFDGGGSGGDGTEQSVVNFTVDGGTSVFNTQGLTVGTGQNVTGTLNIDNGATLDFTNGSTAIIGAFGGTGQVNVTGSSTVDNAHFATVGFNGGNGVLNIEGEGTAFTTRGFTVGDDPNSDGALNVRGGAAVTIERLVSEQFPGITIARDANNVKGRVTIEGSDASGVPTSVLIRGNIPFINVGQDGDGGLEVLDGARLTLEGLDSATGAPTNAAIQVGRNNGSLGSMRVSDATVSLSGTAGRSTLRVGREAGSDGTLLIEAGGKVLITDDAGAVRIGANAATAKGVVTVRGSGSVLQTAVVDVITTLDNESRTFIGEFGNGTLNVEDGARVEGGIFGRVGSSAGSVGVLNVSGQDAGGVASTFRLSGSGGSIPSGANSGQGAFLTVGLFGVGLADITNGGKIVIDGGTDGDNFGFQAGRGAGSDGTVNVTGEGSSIELTGTQNGRINIGALDDSVGALNILGGGSVVQNSTGTSFIGRDVGAVGTVVVSGKDASDVGSLLDAGRFLGIGVQEDEVTSGGTGSLTVSDGGRVVADQIAIGANGVLNGNGGEVTGDVVVFDGGIFAPGSSPGTFTINGNLTAQAGAIIQIEIGNSPGESDFIEVNGSLQFTDGVTLELVFADDFIFVDPIDITDFFTDDSDLVDALANTEFAVEFYSDAAVFDDPTFNLAGLVDANKLGSASSFASAVRAANQASTSNIINQEVPEPATLALLALGIAGIGRVRRARKAA